MRECRFCGSTDARGLVLLGGEHLCPRCASSPLCDECGHPRGSHTGVFRDGTQACTHLWLDLPSLTKVTCGCRGFRPVDGSFRDATFAQDDADLDLRLA